MTRVVTQESAATATESALSISMHEGPCSEYFGRCLYEREIPSHDDLVTPLVVRTTEFLAREGLIEDAERQATQLCLTEALRNGVLHGNRKRFDCKVRLRVYQRVDAWSILVEDEGGGFDAKDLSGGSEEDSLWKSSGRGIRILQHYMDRVSFYCGGSVLLMEKTARDTVSADSEG